ncbi:MAG: peptide ABC transporter ATP-binding protein [Bdellovibrionaceae bacterium]|nr:peptide ABC transporter ATP-binding protein [Pseudobdellovibrionaceae bacterium]
MKNIPVLSVKNLKTQFQTEHGVVTAVDRVSFDVFSGKTLGIVGESGCGKSVTSLSIMKLVSDPGKIVEGEILLRDRNLIPLSEKDMRKIRGNEISMIFQEPMTSLNPVFTIGNQIIEAIQVHQSISKKDARKKAIELLTLVGIPSPEKRIDDYPHQLSGGMRQRVMIAMALSCDPSVLIADEPTTALDVTIQAQILELIKKIQSEREMSVVLITHDLGVVAEVCDHVVVMYAGKIVEQADVQTLFSNPKHPYTRGLLKSLPGYRGNVKARLETIPGMVPSLHELPKGCRFQTRCSSKRDICEKEEPPLKEIGGIESFAHSVRCIKEVTDV